MLPQFNQYQLKGVVAEYQQLKNQGLKQVDIEDFLGYLESCEFIAPFDWLNWVKTIGSHWQDDLGLIDNGDIETLRRLVMAHLRFNRGLDGHIESLFTNGYMDRVFNRVDQLTP